MQASDEHVAWAHIVVHRHNQVRQLQLMAGLPCEPRQLPNYRIRPQRAQQFELRLTRACRASIRQIDDFALGGTVDGAVRLRDETCDGARVPVIAPRLPLSAIHTLLYDGPPTLAGHKEPVQIELKAVLHRGAIDLGNEPAGLDQGLRIDAEAIPEHGEFFGGPP